MKYVCFFSEPGATELAQMGGKGTNLGKMTRAGFPIPSGFCISADAYRYLIEVTGLSPIIARLIAGIDFRETAVVEEKACHIRELISQQPIPLHIAAEIQAAYDQLGTITGEAPSQMLPVAVRSSATAEELPDASFAGLQETYLNVRGQQSVLEHVRRCWASLWTARAISYRHQQGFDQQQVYLAVVVQSMIDPETSGIAFSANPISGNCDECMIYASWGLGEAIVSGVVSPDTYAVRKIDGRISQKHIAYKERMITSSIEGGAVEMETTAHLRDIPALSERQVAELTALVTRIEAYYGTPQDIEWAHLNGHWYILQSRPIMTLRERRQINASLGKYSQAIFVEIFIEIQHTRNGNSILDRLRKVAQQIA